MKEKEIFTVCQIFGEQQVTEKFKKREVLFSYMDGNYEKKVIMQFCNDRVDNVQELNVGDECEVGFTIESRYWEQGDRYFTSVTAWNVKVVKPNTPVYTPSSGMEGQQAAFENAPGLNTFGNDDKTKLDDDSDLPF